MFKKLNVKVLIILLIILLGVYFISEMFDTDERSFRSKLADFDNSNVTSLIIESSKGDKVKVVKESDIWKVVSDGKSYLADESTINNNLNLLNNLKVKRVAATEKSKWTEYQVVDTMAVRLIVEENNDEVLNMFIGKFSYKQPDNTQQLQNPNQRQQPIITSFVRLDDDDIVYAVDGFLKMNFNADINSYRYKKLTDLNRDDIEKLDFSSTQNKPFLLSKQDGKWFVNGVQADSSKTVKYLNTLSRLSSSSFVYDVSENQLPSSAFTVKIEGNNFNPIEIKAFPADSVNQYLISSTNVDDALFSGSSSKLFERIFVGEGGFLPGE
jgi:hypothetical protein